MNVIGWNTGCLYQSYGQVVLAVVLDEKRIVFNDVSRGIDGVIDVDTENLVTDADVKRVVMYRYLHNHYRWHQNDTEIGARHILNRVDIEQYKKK